MTHFRRELLLDHGPERLVVEHNPGRFAGAEVFYVRREGAAKQIAQITTLEQLDWVKSQLEDLALRESVQEHATT